MAYIYNGQLDAFDLYHQVQESQDQNKGANQIDPVLPALGHAIAGSAGSAISNIVTYPLALTVTRLQVQRQSGGLDNAKEKDQYRSIPDALGKIYISDGIAGLFRGADAATVKTVTDSFLFFLSYNFLRHSRLYASASGRSSAIEELKISFLSGAFAKLLTTPIANIVTRKQIIGKDGSERSDNSITAIAKSIHQARGISGFWSGYSASLILTLNPSLTFFCFDILKKLLLPRDNRSKPSPRATFFLAALSKAIASTVTYPFSLAKTRLQVSRPNRNGSGDANSPLHGKPSNIVSVIMQIVEKEGTWGLYDGVQGEVAKGFLSHGITMLTKDLVHGIILRLYYIILKTLRRYPSTKKLTSSAAQRVSATAGQAMRVISSPKLGT